MSNARIIFILIICICLINACTSTRYTDKSHDREYKKENKEIEADYVIYHFEEQNSRIYYSISNKDVIYKKADTSKYFAATLKLFYKIIPEPDSKQIADSATVTVTDRGAEVRQQQITERVN